MKIVLFVGYFVGCIAMLNATPPGRPRLEPRTDNQLTTTSTTEAPAICLPDEFRCDDNHCIAAPRRCDGYPDCRDGSDEIDCPSSVPTCGPNQFTCTITRQCVPIESVCNNRTECSDGTDEADCPDAPTQTPRPIRCRSDKHECGDGHCIPLQRRCDGFPDCRDHTDELGCAAVTDQSTTDTEVSTTAEPNQPKPAIAVVIREPAIQIVAPGFTIRYNCRAQSAFGGSVIVKWSKEDSTLPPTRSVDDGNGNLVVINAGTSDTGTYVCTAYDNRTYVSQRAYLTVGEQSAPKVVSRQAALLNTEILRPCNAALPRYELRTLV